MIEANKQLVRFGWAHFGAIRLPCIERGKGLRLLANRLVDDYLSQSQLIIDRRSFMQMQRYQLTTPEAELLNQLCGDGMKAQLCFTSADVAFSLEEVRKFSDLYKQRYPEVRTWSEMPDAVQRPPACSPDWILVRDSVIPCVVRAGELLLPLNVLRGAPQVLVDVVVDTTSATADEVWRLNELCRNSKLTFTFTGGTDLVRVSDLRALCPGVRIEPLASNNPLLALKTSMLQATNAEQDNEPEKRPHSEEISGKVRKQSYETSKCHETPKRSDITESRTERTMDNGSPKSSSTGDGDSDQDQVMLSDICPPPLIPISEINVNDVSGLRHISSSCETEVNTVVPREQEQEDDNKGKAANDSKNSDESVLKKSAECCPKVEIVQVECFKRTLSCITRGKLRTKYVLVESVMRLYFPQCRLVEFIEYLTCELAVTLHTLKKREEQALIKFYGIPTDRLHTNLIIRLKDFVPRVAWLQDRFGDMDVPDAVKPPPLSSIISQKNKEPPASYSMKPPTSYSMIAAARNVGMQEPYKETPPKAMAPQYPNPMLAWNARTMIDAVNSGAINTNISNRVAVSHVNADVPYCCQMPQPNWTSIPYPWAAMMNAGNTAAAAAAGNMKLPIYSTSNISKMQQLDFGFQQIPNNKRKTSSGNVIRDIQSLVNGEFDMFCHHPKTPYTYDPRGHALDVSRANRTSEKRVQRPVVFPSKRMALDLPGLRYPVHQLGIEGSSPCLPINL